MFYPFTRADEPRAAADLDAVADGAVAVVGAVVGTVEGEAGAGAPFAGASGLGACSSVVQAPRRRNCYGAAAGESRCQRRL